MESLQGPQERSALQASPIFVSGCTKQGLEGFAERAWRLKVGSKESESVTWSRMFGIYSRI
jgi:hypothetical protein